MNSLWAADCDRSSSLPVSSGAKHLLKCRVWLFLMLSPCLRAVHASFFFSRWYFRAHIPMLQHLLCYLSALRWFRRCVCHQFLFKDDTCYQTSFCLCACFPYLAVNVWLCSVGGAEGDLLVKKRASFQCDVWCILFQEVKLVQFMVCKAWIEACKV